MIAKRLSYNLRINSFRAKLQCITVVLTCKGDQLSLSCRIGNLEYENFETHESIDLTFGMGDYVGDITPHAKMIGTLGASLQIDEVLLSLASWATVCKTVPLCHWTVVLSCLSCSDCLVCLSVCNVDVLWPNG